METSREGCKQDCRGKWGCLLISFSEFWEAYPRHVGKKVAQRCWDKLGIFEQQAVIDGLRLWKQSVDWQCEPIFIPHASTFLNQRRWEDEPIIYARPVERREPTAEQAERNRQSIAEILKRHPDLA